VELGGCGTDLAWVIVHAEAGNMVGETYAAKRVVVSDAQRAAMSEM